MRSGAGGRAARREDLPCGGGARERSGGGIARGRPEKAKPGPEDRTCKELMQRAKLTLGGAGVLAKHTANRAEIR